MGLETPLTDESIESAQSACPALGVSPPHKRRTPNEFAMSHRQIAIVLGCSSQTVVNIERSAIKKLAVLLQ